VVLLFYVFFLDKRIKIHAGKKYMTLNINNVIYIGHKLGDFSFTKVRGYDITQSGSLKKKQKIKLKSKKKI